MVDFTRQANGRGKRVPITFSTRRSAGPYAFRDHCDQHGTHAELDLDTAALLIEAQGMEWRPRDRYNASHCEACFNELRGTALPSDAELKTVVRRVVDDHWRDVRDAFEPAYLEAVGDIEYCPFCGVELVSASGDDDREKEIVCETHGRIGVTIRQLEEAVLHA